MKKVKLTKEQQRILELIESTGDNFFITGRAGTGKSTLLSALTTSTEKRVAVCAPTGVAALNVQGTTIHSLFFLPIGLIGNERLTQTPQKRKLLQAIELLVIDEISMVNADVMDAIDRALREVRHKRGVPFGGVQVVMFGDPYQLAPVPPRSQEEKAYFADHYRSMWFFDAHVWEQTPMRIVELTEIHRQRDEEFKHMLNAVRHGKVTPEIGRALNEAGDRPAPTGDIITLATTNDAVARINATALAQLAGETKTAAANVDGDFPPGWFPADEELTLKVGAQVMFLRNDSDQRWVNGTVGHVTRIGKTVHVEVHDGDSTVEHEVLPAVWERYRYDYDPETKTLEREVIAEFTQFPLRLAWAVTIHKSQGQTYERAIIDMGNRAFAPGQTYVALSRITSLDGLYLTRGLTPRDVMVDADVERFMGEVDTFNAPD